MQEIHRHTTAAIRHSDNRRVLIKVIVSPFREFSAPNEHEIHTWLLSDERDKHPENHTIPILETLRCTVDLPLGTHSAAPVYHRAAPQFILHVLPWLQALEGINPYIQFQNVFFVKQILEVGTTRLA